MVHAGDAEQGWSLGDVLAWEQAYGGIPAAANVVGFENLTNLDQVPPVGAWVVALPMNIAEGSGGPVRVVALHK